MSKWREKFLGVTQEIRASKNSMAFFALLILGVATKLYLVDQTIDVELDFPFQSYVRFFFITIASSAILMLPYFFVGRRMWVMFILLSLLDAFLLSHLWYFRTYYSIIPLFAFEQLQNLDGLGPSILSSVRILDFALPLSTVALMITYWRFFRSRREPVRLRTRFMALGIILSYSVLLIVLDVSATYVKDHTLETKYDQWKFNQVAAAKYYGLLSCWLWQAKEVLTPSTYQSEGASGKIDNWLSEKKVTQSLLESSEQRKNLIVIIVESLESWPVGCRVGGIEITPFLNRLIASEKRLFAPRVVEQTRHGRSSDTQLIINTGLLPISNGSAFFRFAHNEYYSLAKALREKFGYATLTFMGNSPSFWNQGAMNPSLGFATLVSSHDFDMSDVLTMGLSDESFFNQAVGKIKSLHEPFYIQMITLSSHGPFKIPPERVDLQLPSDVPESLSDYLKAMSYVDKAIGIFFESLRNAGLFERTVFVILGDHEALVRDTRRELLNDKYGKALITDTPFIPFIVINSHVSMDYTEVMGEIDIYPTLLDLFGLTDYRWTGLGYSLLRKPKNGFAVSSLGEIVGDTTSVPQEELAHAVLAWEISDIIISSNWFKKGKSSIEVVTRNDGKD